MGHQPDTKNQNQEPEGRRKLFHRSDLCTLDGSGHVRILTHRGEWLPYGGGDDDGFRYGNLVGTEARRAAEADAKGAPIPRVGTTPVRAESSDGLPDRLPNPTPVS